MLAQVSMRQVSGVTDKCLVDTFLHQYQHSVVKRCTGPARSMATDRGRLIIFRLFPVADKLFHELGVHGAWSCDFSR